MRITEGQFALGALVIFAVWIFIILPTLYAPDVIRVYQPYPTAAAQNTNATPNGSQQSPFFTQILPGPDAAERANQENEDRLEKKYSDRWIVRWTMALFFATALLFFVTSGLCIFANRQIGVMKETLAETKRRDKIIYRAYISGGGIAGKGTVTKKGVSREALVFRLDINNYGQTPGEWIEYGIGFCEFSDVKNLPEQPVYKWYYYRDIVKPGIGSNPKKVVEIPPKYSDPVIYGRFGYTDVFNDWHSEGFFQRGAIPIKPPHDSYLASDPSWYGRNTGDRKYEVEEEAEEKDENGKVGDSEHR